MSAKEIYASADREMIRLFQEQIPNWPNDQESERIHVFQLGKKTAIPLSKQKFIGPNRGYFHLIDFIEQKYEFNNSLSWIHYAQDEFTNLRFVVTEHI